jgi:F0F1-type ATP synthase membrane subunit b/b'
VIAKWLRKKTHKPQPSHGQEEADKALEKTEQELRDVHEHHSEIMTEAGKLARLGERNNFAEALHRALGGAQ